MSHDMEAVVKGIKSLPPEEALETSLCLLNLLLPFAKGNQEFVAFLTELRDALLGK
jgi:hypothetical protein